MFDIFMTIIVYSFFIFLALKAATDIYLLIKFSKNHIETKNLPHRLMGMQFSCNMDKAYWFYDTRNGRYSVRSRGKELWDGKMPVLTQPFSHCTEDTTMVHAIYKLLPEDIQKDMVI